MAKVYRAPEGFEPPEITSEDYREGRWMQIETDYLERLKTFARQEAVPPQDVDLIGEIIRFPRGDGYAQYMVWTTRPLQLIWIELGDAWQVEDALIRGLRLADVRAQVDGERKWRELIARKREEVASK